MGTSTIPGFQQPTDYASLMGGWGQQDYGSPLAQAAAASAMQPTVAMPWMQGVAQVDPGQLASGLAQFGGADLGIDAIGPVAQGAGAGGGFLDGFLGKTTNGVTTQGWGGMALGAGQGLMNAFMGMKQYGLAKDTLNENKRQYNQNYAAQQKTTNARLEDRQTARITAAGGVGAYQSVGDYMKKNGI